MCGCALPAVFLAFLQSVGWAELVVIFLILLLLFGTRLPSVMRSLGKGVSEFKKGVRDIEDELTREPPAGGSGGADAKKPDEHVPAKPEVEHKDQAHYSKDERPGGSDGDDLAG